MSPWIVTMVTSPETRCSICIGPPSAAPRRVRSSILCEIRMRRLATGRHDLRWTRQSGGCSACESHRWRRHRHDLPHPRGDNALALVDELHEEPGVDGAYLEETATHRAPGKVGAGMLR